MAVHGVFFLFKVISRCVSDVCHRNPARSFLCHAQSSPHAFAYVRVLELRGVPGAKQRRQKVNVDLMDEKKHANLSNVRRLIDISLKTANHKYHG